MQVFEKPLSEAERTEIAYSLRWALRSVQAEPLMEKLIISEFMHALNRRKLILNDDVEGAIQKALEPLKISTPQTDQHTNRTNPLNKWRAQARF